MVLVILNTPVEPLLIPLPEAVVYPINEKRILEKLAPRPQINYHHNIDCGTNCHGGYPNLNPP